MLPGAILAGSCTVTCKVQLVIKYGMGIGAKQLVMLLTMLLDSAAITMMMIMCIWKPLTVIDWSTGGIHLRKERQPFIASSLRVKCRLTQNHESKFEKTRGLLLSRECAVSIRPDQLCGA